jgi:hypothetical protein
MIDLATHFSSWVTSDDYLKGVLVALQNSVDAEGNVQ